MALAASREERVEINSAEKKPAIKEIDEFLRCSLNSRQEDDREEN